MTLILATGGVTLFVLALAGVIVWKGLGWLVHEEWDEL